jgi:aspartate/methionine/tyrosine aminotransferase
VPASFVRFDLERLLSTWENRVAYNLSESGVRSVAPRALLDAAGIDELIDGELNYPQANGLGVLRERIAALYPNAGPENVLVTVGASQANFTAFIALTQPGDAVAVMQPNYQQIWGLAQNFGRALSTFALRPDLDWRLDRDDLTAAVTSATAFVAIVNPNNPTGRVLSIDERRAVVEAAAAAGAWLLSDEVYAGAEHAGDAITPSFYGEYERVLAVGSLSKAYGLPGLRIGWIVGPADAIDRLWAWQDYVTISTGMLDNRLAAIALLPDVRARLFDRARSYVRRGFANLARWAAARDDVEVFPPQAGAISLVKYRQAINSTALAMRLIEEQSTLVAPGDLFGVDGFLRISFGLRDDYVNEGLRRIGETLAALKVMR